MLELHFSHDYVLSTVLRDGQGNPVYRIDSPLKLKNNATTISRFAAPPSSTLSIAGPSSSATTFAPEDDSDLERASVDIDKKSSDLDWDIPQLAETEEHVVAQIMWKYFKQPAFRFGGEEVKLKEYMPPSSFFQLGRVFTAKNGQKYKWVAGKDLLTCRLERNDDPDTVVARFHCRVIALFRKSRGPSSPYLEIADELIPILDEVIMSFVYFKWELDQVVQNN